MDTLQNAPTSNKLINYRPIAEIAVGLMLGIAVCGIMPAGGAAVLCIMTACGAAGVVFALLRHTRSALFAASVLVGILFAALRLPTELPNGSYTVSGTVLSAEYSDGETELILTKSELHSSSSAGIFRREGRVKIITEGYLNIDVGDGVYIPKVYLRGAAKADSSERSRFLKQLSEGITASGRLYGGGLNDDGSTSVDEIGVVSKHNLPVREALTSVRSSIVRHIGRIFGTDAGIDVFHVLCLAGTLSGEAHQFATSLDNLLSLLYASLGIIGVGGGHRLDADRIIATQAEGSDMCHRRGTAGIIE